MEPYQLPYGSKPSRRPTIWRLLIVSWLIVVALGGTLAFVLDKFTG